MDVHYCDCSSDELHSQQWRDMFPPQAVDQAVGHAISMCWMLMPQDKKKPDAVAAEIRRIVERALASLHEDARVFGFADAQ